MSGGHLSKDFFEFVKSIGESRSKQEEDQIILREVGVLKKAMAAQNVTAKMMKEYIMRMIYVEMLGQDASFGHIQAVKMVSQKDLLLKRVGYLACSLTLHQDHQFMLLLVNTIQTDLKSDNYLEVTMALTVVSKLVNAELTPVILPLVLKCLDHQQAHVRKKAVAVLHRFYQIDSTCIAPNINKIRRVLCDKDPAVMGASLWLFMDLCATTPSLYKDLVPSFVSILKQVTDHRLPRDFDYHRMPAPWIQLCLLQILASLGTADKSASEGMYEILQEVMKRADVGINVGYAIVYECVRTVTAIYPDSSLIEEASRAISRFISSDNHNLKYLGINALASILQINPKYAIEHQMIVIDCLEDPDETLKRKTLDLLFSMTNPVNVRMVVDKLTAYLKNATDVYLRTDLVSRITQLAEKYAPDNGWYIHTMNDVFELGGDLVRPEVAHNLMRLIAEAGEIADGSDSDIRVYAVSTYLELLKKSVLPDVLYQVVAWVLGEYGFRVQGGDVLDVINHLMVAIDRPFERNSTRAWFLSAIMKLTALLSSIPPQVETLVTRLQHSLHIDLQQRAHEFLELAKAPKSMKAVLPSNKAAEPVVVDEDLKFLDWYVQEALQNGAAPYNPPLEGAASDAYGSDSKESSAPDTSSSKKDSKLLFAPYAPSTPYVSVSSNGASRKESYAAEIEEKSAPSQPVEETSTLKVKKNVWTSQGFNAASAAQDIKPVAVDSGRISPRDEKPAPTSSSFTKKEKEPARKRSLTEKELMAQSLFQGLDGSIPTTTPVGSPPARFVSAVAASTLSRAPSTTGLRNATSAAPAAASSASAAAASTVPSQPKPSASVDLLPFDLLDTPLPSSSPSAPAPTPVAAPNKVVGIFDGLNSAKPVAAPSTTAPAPKPTSLDPFADLNAAFASPAPPSNSLNPLGNLMSSIGSPMGSNPVNPMAAIMNPMVANPMGSLMNPMASNVNAMNVPSMMPGSSIRSQPQSAPIPVQSANQSSVNLLNDLFGNSFPSSSAQPQAPLKMESTLQPEMLSTPQYGALWKQFPAELKFAVAPSSCTTPLDFMSRMEKQMLLHPVEIKNQEMICAGRSLFFNAVVLVHGKIRQGRVEVMVKSSHPQLANNVCIILKKVLA